MRSLVTGQGQNMNGEEESKLGINKAESIPFCRSEDGYEVEYCSVCEREIELRWDINVDGFQAYCPVCGSRLMLCDACMHRFGELVDDCDFQLRGTGTCRFSRPKDWWKEAQE